MSMGVLMGNHQASSLSGQHSTFLGQDRVHALLTPFKRKSSACGYVQPTCIAEKHRPHTINADEVFKDKPVGRGFQDANFPLDFEGRTYHLGTKAGEVAPRILLVGSTKRARLLAPLLRPPGGERDLFQLESSRGFLTITGEFEGTPVSIVSTHMGMPNMDFTVRECHAVIPCPMAIIRLGTCGAVRHPAHLGDCIVASEGSVCIRRDPDYFTMLGREPTTKDVVGSARGAYTISLPVMPDQDLSRMLAAKLRQLPLTVDVFEAMNASADSFYSSQGRTTLFQDENQDVLDDLMELYPAAMSLEMETFQLFDLARCSLGTIHAAAMAIVLAERHTNEFLDPSDARHLELQAGLACIQALVDFSLIPRHVEYKSDITPIWQQRLHPIPPQHF